MAAPRFYAPQLAEGRMELEPQEAEHASGAKRLRAGDEVEVFDGCGQVGSGVLLEAGRSLAVEVQRLWREEPAEVRCSVAVAVPKGKRLQVMVEKLTELGVARIQPVRFARSVAEGGDPVSKWGRWTVEAAKQCRRAWLPEIAAPVSFADFIAATDPHRTVLADADGETPPVLLHALRGNPEVVCLVGPEGGLTPEEFAACDAAGVRRLRLGEHILRIETAALAFCACASAWRA